MTVHHTIRARKVTIYLEFRVSETYLRTDGR
jgi:hypothetical protein